MASKKELSFKKYAAPRNGGRWCKKIDGTLHYFGTGKSKSDTKSYQQSLSKYRAFRDNELVEDHTRWLARAFFETKLEGYYGKDAPAVIERIRSGNSPSASEAVDDEQEEGLDDFGETTGDDRKQPTLPELLAQIDRRSYLEGLSKPKAHAESGRVKIGDYIDMWLSEQRSHWRSGGMKEKSFVSKEHGIKTFRDFVRDASFGGLQAVESMLSGYRAGLIEKLEQGTYKGNTVNDKLKFLRQFIKWCYERRILSELPRVMGSVTKQVKTVKGGKPLAHSVVAKLWEGADDRMKCWIAIALNCGFKNIDVAETLGDHIQGGRLLAMRHKEPVPMNYKLWPITQEFISETRQDCIGQPRLFMNKVGRPIVRDRSDGLGKLFGKLAKRVGVKATFQQLRDTGAEFVRSWCRQNSIPGQGLVQLYLAHRDGSTAQYYLSNDPRDVQAEVLDEATDALAASLRLQT